MGLTALDVDSYAGDIAFVTPNGRLQPFKRLRRLKFERDFRLALIVVIAFGVAEVALDVIRGDIDGAWMYVLAALTVLLLFGWVGHGVRRN